MFLLFLLRQKASLPICVMDPIFFPAKDHFVIVVQSPTHVWLFETPWTATLQRSESPQFFPLTLSASSVFHFLRTLLPIYKYTIYYILYLKTNNENQSFLLSPLFLLVTTPFLCFLLQQNSLKLLPIFMISNSTPLFLIESLQRNHY